MPIAGITDSVAGRPSLVVLLQVPSSTPVLRRTADWPAAATAVQQPCSNRVSALGVVKNCHFEFNSSCPYDESGDNLWLSRIEPHHGRYQQRHNRQDSGGFLLVYCSASTSYITFSLLLSCKKFSKQEKHIRTQLAGGRHRTCYKTAQQMKPKSTNGMKRRLGGLTTKTCTCSPPSSSNIASESHAPASLEHPLWGRDRQSMGMQGGPTPSMDSPWATAQPRDQHRWVSNDVSSNDWWVSNNVSSPDRFPINWESQHITSNFLGRV
jgi:hypothetical protein